jgi:hypothetical protein
MKKSLTVAMAAITLGGAICATAAPAQARDYRGGHYRDYRDYRHDGNRTGTALAAGAIGLALGAALAGSNHNNGGYGRDGYGYGYSNGRGYYADSYYAPRYARAYRVCEDSRWVWDPYIRRNVLIRSEYAC